MKTNNYIQPKVEVMTVLTAQNVLSESNPFMYGGEDINDADPV